MADETLQTIPAEAAAATHPPPATVEETKTPPPQEPIPIPEPHLASVTEPEPVSEPLLAAVSLDLQKDALPLPEPPLAAAEENLQEAVTVIERDTPLEPPPPEPPLSEEHVTITATEKDSTFSAAAHVSQPLAAALAVPQETESPKTESKEMIEPEKHKETGKKLKAPESFASFKEESNKISDLSNPELKSLQDFKLLVQEALNNGTLLSPASTSSNLPEETSIWGVPLLKDDRSDVILLKFLRARDFKPKESFSMLKNTLKWRREFNVDELVDEDLGDDLDKIVFMHGHDKEGHPVCYNVYGEFQNKELYVRTFGDDEKRKKFLRWRIQFLERSIRKMDFSPGGINTVFQVSDLKNSPGPGKRELRAATKHSLQILQDNYPEFVAKQVFINVPWWYLAFYTMMSPFLTQRTKSKFVFTSPAKTAETLFKYVMPEQVPTQYGGLSVDYCECNPEFTVDDPAMEVIVKPATKQIVEIIVHEQCMLVWELRVVGWEVSYSAEYVPNAEHAYTVIIHKTKKMLPSDEPVVSNSFNVSELGKILLTVDNPTAKKKKLLYRYKVMPCVA
ncbi:Patellin-3 [Castilleja foliolosa]|uniref:Patellin-3 n=1 Tax=Castilleja foliolosa TaxID=1961234 RepID=A0ABD3DGI9_9LAMI